MAWLAVRREWVKELTDKRMSTREIAPVVNASDWTVREDRKKNDQDARNLAGRSTSEAFARYLRETRAYAATLIGLEAVALKAIFPGQGIRGHCDP